MFGLPCKHSRCETECYLLNDLEDYLIKANCNAVEMSDISAELWLKLIIIMYADDTILLAGSAIDLQKGLNELKSYCNKWKLQINNDKTKIMIFANRKVKKEQ